MKKAFAEPRCRNTDILKEQAEKVNFVAVRNMITGSVEEFTLCLKRDLRRLARAENAREILAGFFNTVNTGICPAQDMSRENADVAAEFCVYMNSMAMETVRTIWGVMIQASMKRNQKVLESSSNAEEKLQLEKMLDWIMNQYLNALGYEAAKAPARLADSVLKPYSEGF